MAVQGPAAAARIHVEAWSPEYGSPIERQELQATDAPVDVAVELPPAAWRPLDADAAAQPATCVEFVDGVRRIDARVWLTEAPGAARMGICASWAAGLARCDGANAHVTTLEVRRGLFAHAGAPRLHTRAGIYEPMAVPGDDIDQLTLALQQRMGELEIAVAAAGSLGNGRDGTPPFIVVDGPLSGRQNVPGAIGYVKTHRVAYLGEEVAGVVATLRPGQRTPLFLTQTSWSRYSWYLRLPGGEGHAWAGVVRCEASADLELEHARRMADTSARTLPRFASAAHKDPRAPQNLYPIAALERELRRRLGDAQWVWRALKRAAGPR